MPKTPGQIAAFASDIHRATAPLREARLRATLASRGAEIVLLRAMLERLEFAGENLYPYYQCCPVCGGEDRQGHLADCELAALLNPP